MGIVADYKKELRNLRQVREEGRFEGLLEAQRIALLVSTNSRAHDPDDPMAALKEFMASLEERLKQARRRTRG